MTRPPLAIATHGGAGSAEAMTQRTAGVRRAAGAGWRVLARGGSALDAVIEAVALMEDDPAFNAGRGSFLTTEGHVEMDASVMDGRDLRAGAVGMVRRVANPVRLARHVMDHGREVFLVGPPADRAARAAGLRMVRPADLVTPAAVRLWRRHASNEPPGETVGAVACDAAGHVAAATSTGGVPGKRSGRIGDSAVIGAGTYADDGVGAGSATGPGEAIIRLGLVRTALAAIAAGVPAQTAAARALALLRRRVGASAGVILVDAHGRIGIARTTAAMPAAWRTVLDARTQSRR